MGSEGIQSAARQAETDGAVETFLIPGVGETGTDQAGLGVVLENEGKQKRGRINWHLSHREATGSSLSVRHSQILLSASGIVGSLFDISGCEATLFLSTVVRHDISCKNPDYRA